MRQQERAKTLDLDGGFKPFGGDYQAGLPGGASENGVFSRLPGQWESEIWADSSLGLHFNVMRWYSSATGTYSRSDPLGVDAERLRSGSLALNQLYSYAGGNPIAFEDRLGLERQRCDSLKEPCPSDCDPQKLTEELTSATRVRSLYCEAARRGVDESPIKGKESEYRQAGGIDDDGAWFDPQPGSTVCQSWCTCVHEKKHLEQRNDPRRRQMILDGLSPRQINNREECAAHNSTVECIINFVQGGGQS